MAFTSITAASIEVGKALKKSLFTLIKDNLDDLDSRISALSASANKISVFEYSIDPKDFHIGEIISSDMTTAEFQTVHGNGWILADGSSCTGSVYASITGHSIVPDLQDEFLRGAGTKALGSSNADTTAVNGLGATTDTHIEADHTHVQQKGSSSGALSASTAPNAYNATVYSGIGTAPGGGFSHDHATTLLGDSETAPQHYAVNFFIKINLSAQDNIHNIIAKEDFTIVNVLGYIVDVNGLPTSGSFEFDIRKGSTRATLTSIFTTKPVRAYTGTEIDGTPTSSGTFAAGGASVTQGQFLALDITGIMAGQSSLIINVYAEPS